MGLCAEWQHQPGQQYFLVYLDAARVPEPYTKVFSARFRRLNIPSRSNAIPIPGM